MFLEPMRLRYLETLKGTGKVIRKVLPRDIYITGVTYQKRKRQSWHNVQCGIQNQSEHKIRQLLRSLKQEISPGPF